MNVTDPVRALEILGFASFLLRELDAATTGAASEEITSRRAPASRTVSSAPTGRSAANRSDLVFDWETVDALEPLMSKLHWSTVTSKFYDTSVLRPLSELETFVSKRRSRMDETVLAPLDAYVLLVGQGVHELRPDKNVPRTIVPADCERRAKEKFQEAEKAREEVIRAIREIRRRYGNR